MNENFVQVVVLVLSGLSAGVVLGYALANKQGGPLNSAYGERRESHNPKKGPRVQMVKIPKKLLDMLESTLVGIAFLAFGWGLSIIVEGYVDYWRFVSLGEALLLGVVLIVVALLLQYQE